MITIFLQIRPWLLVLLFAGWMVFQLFSGIATVPLGVVKRKQSQSVYWMIIGAELFVLFIAMTGSFYR